MIKTAKLLFKKGCSNDAGAIGHPKAKKKAKLDLSLTSYIKINSIGPKT